MHAEKYKERRFKTIEERELLGRTIGNAYNRDRAFPRMQFELPTALIGVLMRETTSYESFEMVTHTRIRAL